MGKTRQLILIFSTMVLLSCTPQPESIVPSGEYQDGSPIPVAEVVAEAEVVSPTATSPPTQTPTLEPTATAPPTVTPSPSPVATATPPPTQTAEPTELPTEGPPPYRGWPDQLYLPFGFGNFGEPILVVELGVPQFKPSPVEIEVFFDFDSQIGGIAYGSTFWESASNSSDGVTDLTIYRFEDETTTTLISENVGRAIWLDGTGQLAVALHNGSGFDLALVDLEGGIDLVAEGIDPYFSYSPQDRSVAFVSEGTLRYFQIDEREILSTNSSDIYQEGGWVGDAPLFVANETESMLAVAEAPLLFVSLGGEDQEPFVPTYLDEEPLEEARPLQMIWSASLNQLIVQEENLNQSVRIYLFSEDLQFVTDSYTLDQVELVDFFVEGEQLLLLDIDNQPVVWDLQTYTYIEVEDS